MQLKLVDPAEKRTYRRLGQALYEHIAQLEPAKVAHYRWLAGELLRQGARRH